MISALQKREVPTAPPPMPTWLDLLTVPPPPFRKAQDVRCTVCPMCNNRPRAVAADGALYSYCKVCASRRAQKYYKERIKKK